MFSSPQDTPETLSQPQALGSLGSCTLSLERKAFGAWEGGAGTLADATGGREPTGRDDRRRRARRCGVCAHNLFATPLGYLAPLLRLLFSGLPRLAPGKHFCVPQPHTIWGSSQ